MKFQMNRDVTWTTLELTGLLEDEESHVHFTRTTKHVALHPYHLNNLQRGLSHILRSSLNSYDRELKGFVLAFRNPKLLSNLGEMLYDSPFIHIDIEADFYLFRPMVGSLLKGIVNKKGLDHIVMLVHKIYTVSIPKPDNTDEWPGELVEIGQEVKCCVTHIDNKSKPPFICATLRSDYSQGCRLSESMNNIDNVDSAMESVNSTMQIETNGISEDEGVSEKEKKKHRKKHKKSRESSSEFVCKVESESESYDNVGNGTSKTIKSEKKQQYQSTQDTVVNTDDSFNNSEVDNVSKKHKKSKKSKSLLSNDTILDEHTESRKAVKRESSIPLDSVTETETKKRKKHAKKSKESDPKSVLVKTEKEEEVAISTENTIPRYIKSEEEKQHKKHIISNVDLFSNNFEDNVSKKHKKSKKPSMIMSDSESESHVKIKIEKPDPFIDRITNEGSKSQTSCSETQVVQNLDKTFEMPEFLKRENTIEHDTKKERKKSSKKHTAKDSQSKSVKIKNEDNVISDVSNVSDNERKKSPKKHSARDSQLKSVKIKNEDNVISDVSNASDNERKKSPKKHSARDSQSEPVKIKNEDNVTSDVSNVSDNDRKKSPKKHSARDSQLKFVKIKNEDDVISDVSNVSDNERKKSPKKHANHVRDVRDSYSEIRIKSENITNNANDIFRTIKRDPEESQHTMCNTSAIGSDSCSSDIDHVLKKSKKKMPTILSDSELKYPIKVKIEKD